jgi:uncharacterized protein YjbJ (UPF0337 family)
MLQALGKNATEQPEEFARKSPISPVNDWNSAFGAEIATKTTEGVFDMNSDQFEGKWKQLKGTVKQRWGKLTDDDVTALSGKKDELVGKLQERYGITREQAQREADEWAAAANTDLNTTTTGTHTRTATSGKL